MGSPPAASAGTPERVRCESVAERWSHCPLPFKGEAAMLRQLSRNACVRNYSWGQDAQGVWVSRGCRAEFGPTLDGEQAQAGAAARMRSLRCESRNGAHTRCPAETGQGVRLTRQLSSIDCELGRSWGYDEEGVWVSRGCRAEFLVGANKRGDNFFGRLFQRKKPVQGASAAMPGDDATGRPLRCESLKAQRQVCALKPPAGKVELVRQLSNAACKRGSGWGWDSREVWVDKGCRAEFMVW
ncbi:DUF3011 domain-containing protein [Lysobacter pythonis]|uniref:DUF3011 domain-containing protein n=2 Tax=Solilutibacter pythonis TaxID=2483112 RepID=A0A3M2I000_9GAMM|nr:DUF3011 domain-containing protein [Lysobacter pythonis]